MVVMISDELAHKLPTDTGAASPLINEILQQALWSIEEPEQDRLENRPDWRQKIRTSRQQWANGDAVSHDEVLRWMDQQPE